MPELPEMETYKKLLNQQLGGKVITAVQLNREKSVNIPEPQFIRELEGKQVLQIDRRAKHLIFKLSSQKSLLLHLMLGGWMYIGDEQDSPKRTKQIILSFGEKNLYFIGLRLGYLHLFTDPALEKEFAHLGPEPLEAGFSLAVFRDLLRNKKGKLKTTLPDQHLISGIGNCYSDEICFEAGVRPAAAVGALKEESLSAIHSSIKTVLQNAISHGGYMDNPLYSGDRLTGGYNSHMLVYDREGELCRRCGGTIVKTELSSRKCFYCPECQVE